MSDGANNVQTQPNAGQGANANASGQQAPANQTGDNKAPPAGAQNPPANATSVDTGGEVKGQADVKATWPTDWREQLAGGDAKVLERLKRFNSPNEVHKSWLEADKRLNSGKFREELPKNATPEQMTAWRKANGIPETVDGYDLNFDNGIQIGESDKPIIAEYLKEMHGVNADPAAVKAAVGAYYKIVQKQESEQAEKDADYQADGLTKLREEWGAEFKGNMNSVANMLAGAPDGLKDVLTKGRTEDGQIIGNDPRVLRWLASLSREVNPAATLLPSGGADALSNEIQTIETMLKSEPDKYWAKNNEPMRQRYTKLLEAKQFMSKKAG